MAGSISTIAARVSLDAAGVQQGVNVALKELERLQGFQLRPDFIPLATPAPFVAQSREEFKKSLGPISAYDMALIKTAVEARNAATAIRNLSDATGLEAQKMGASSAALAAKSAGMGKLRIAAQQATFAFDDFVNTIGTGGLIMAIRAVQNNLTMMAVILGGIKAQIIVITAMLAAQIVMSLWSKSVKAAADEVERQVKRVRDALELIKNQIEGQSQKRLELMSVKDIKSSSDAVDALRDNGRKWAEEMNKINALREHAVRVGEELGEARGRKQRGQLTDFEEKRLEILEEEWEKINQQGKALQDNINHHKAVNDELLKQLQMLDQLEARIAAQAEAQRAADADMQARLDKMEMMRDAFKGLDDLSADLTDILNPDQGKIDAIMRDVKKQVEEVNKARGAGIISADEADRMLVDIEDAAAKRIRDANKAAAPTELPSTMQAGSSEAVGTINRAIAQSMNMRDMNREAQQKNTQALDDLRKELQKAENNLVHIVPVL